MPYQPSCELCACVRIPAEEVFLLGDLQVPSEANSVVLFANDGRCRNHPRNQHIAQVIRELGIGTLLCDLMTDEEEGDDEETAQYRNDALWLSKRLLAVTRWVMHEPAAKDLRIGYFGAGGGGAAALIAAAHFGANLGAVVVRDGPVDLARKSLPKVKCPTLLLVGEHDIGGIAMNRQALPMLGGVKEMRVVAGASHLFGEPGALEAMASCGAEWLCHHLAQHSHV